MLWLFDLVLLARPKPLVTRGSVEEAVISSTFRDRRKHLPGTQVENKCMYRVYIFCGRTADDRVLVNFGIIHDFMIPLLASRATINNSMKYKLRYTMYVRVYA